MPWHPGVLALAHGSHSLHFWGSDVGLRQKKRESHLGQMRQFFISDTLDRRTRKEETEIDGKHRGDI